MKLGAYKDQVAVFFLYLLVAGMFTIDFFRALPSIAMIGFIVTVIAGTRPSLLLENFLNHKSCVALTCLFLFLLPSWFYSQNTDYYFERLQIHLPFLMLPLVFPSIRITEKQLRGLYLFFIAWVTFTALHAFIYYLFHQPEVNQLYLESRVMPTLVRHHPTFSIMLAFAIFVTYHMFSNKKLVFGKPDKYFLIGAGFFLLIFIHVFSVRIGLFALYAAIFFESFRLIFLKKNLRTGLTVVIVCLLIGVPTLLFSPTVRNKFINTHVDLEAIKNRQSANNMSLASRMVSYKNAINIAREHGWLFGCGLGDVEDANTQLFRSQNPDISKIIIPHNEFLYLLAATGITGLILFSIFFFYPLFHKQRYLDELLLFHFLILFIAFQFEALIETQLGVAYVLVFILLPLGRTTGLQATGSNIAPDAK